jgi:ElaB/YqjD/DUF883 family membrane-anchored ribosome-binding protein
MCQRATGDRPRKEGRMVAVTRCQAELYGKERKGQNMTTQEANQRLAGDLKLVMRDAEDLLKATAGDAGEKVKEVRSRLAAAMESARATCERVQDKTVQAAKATDHAIREHPYESIGIALGVGLLVGVLIGRR